MVNLFSKRIKFINENTFISSGNTYCDVILNVHHLGFVIRQLFAHDLAPLTMKAGLRIEGCTRRSRVQCASTDIREPAYG